MGKFLIRTLYSYESGYVLENLENDYILKRYDLNFIAELAQRKRHSFSIPKFLMRLQNSVSLIGGIMQSFGLSMAC